MKSIKLVLLISLFSLSLYSTESEPTGFKDLLRPYLVKIIGTEYTDKILGEAPKFLTLPKIPKVTENAKTAVSAENQKLNDEKLKKDNEKYDFYYVDEVFKATKKSPASETEMQEWLNALRQGASREGLYRSIVLGNEYRELERFEDSPTEKVIDLSIKILNKYLDLDADRDSLVKINSYTHKKIIVEKCLEVIDVFASTSMDDLSAWYGVLSAELATDYGYIWKNKSRTKISAFDHQAWAKNVPLQHIKSEVIIKLHMVYNALE